MFVVTTSVVFKKSTTEVVTMNQGKRKVYMGETELKITSRAVISAIERVCAALEAQQEYLTGLDQAVGDGDLGITFSKIAAALREYAHTTPADDLGKFLANAGMVANRAGSSTMGTLLATALMRAGKETKGLAELSAANLAAMMTAVDTGVQERGKASLGDKTVVDALHPAAEAFIASIQAGDNLREAGQKMVTAAEAGRDAVTPLRSRTGRASWVGDRTIGQVDPGCAALVIILRAILG
jgi:phosphoenolpyruvate---glycerone phosphotransferase subunit DhaL